jgi:hypothetical protein
MITNTEMTLQFSTQKSGTKEAKVMPAPKADTSPEKKDAKEIVPALNLDPK